MRSSHIPDSVDPAPRILRIVSAALNAGKERDEDALTVRWCAEVLEGRAMTEAQTNTKLGRLLGSERRVKKVTRTGAEAFRIETKKPPPAPLSPADQRARAREQELGTYEPEDPES